MHTCVYVHSYEYVYKYMYMHTYVCIYVCIAYIHKCKHIYIHIHNSSEEQKAGLNHLRRLAHDTALALELAVSEPLPMRSATLPGCPDWSHPPSAGGNFMLIVICRGRGGG